jgi:transmembrane sensor
MAAVGGIAILARVSEKHPNGTHVYATRPDQQAILNLDEGTRVTLAPQTTLRILQLGSQERVVRLERGEAYFEVTHVPERPFIVQSGAATAQVLGTAFLMRRDASDQHVRVAVTDGKVRVMVRARVDTGVTLTSGQIGDVTDSTAHVSTTDDLAPGTEWAPGRVIFRHTPLSAVLQAVGQWYGYQFRCADQTLGARDVTMGVSTRSSAEALAEIEQVLAVNLTVVGDTVTLVPHSARSSHGAPRIRTYDVWTPTREVGR